MTDYISFPIETDSDALTQEAFDYLASRIPGWLPSEGNLDVWLIEVIAQMTAELRDVASDVPVTIFRYFGKTLVGLPPLDGAHATFTATFTARDNAGYTIPAGTNVVVRDTAGDLVGFTVQTTSIITAGLTSLANIPLIANDIGDTHNGYTPPNGTVTLQDSLEFISSITGASTIVGGSDPETDDAYLSRLSSELRLLTPRPILPNDFAVLSLLVPGVGRALAIDGYNPVGPAFGVARMVSVAVTDAAGLAVSAPVKAAVDALLQAYRETTFVVNVIDPTYTAIAVTATVKALAGFDLTDVDTRVTAAITDYLSPAKWGTPVLGDTPNWVASSTVRYMNIVNVIKDILGVDYIVSLTVNGGTVDVALTGVAPLTTAGVITVTVT